MKNKFATISIITTTILLAGIAIFTAFRLYQTRGTAVAPNVPSSKPKAANEGIPPMPTDSDGGGRNGGVDGNSTNLCSLSFNLTLATSTATSTATSNPTSTPTSTSSSTSSPTATSTATGQPNLCGGTCGSNNNCQSNLMCYQGFCRNASCVTESDCVCGGTATPKPTEASLPDAGTSWPTVMGTGFGILVIIGSLLLAF